MDRFSKLEMLASELTAAVKRLASQQRDGSPQSHHDEYRHVQDAAARIQSLLVEPPDFLNHLANQVRIRLPHF